MKAFSINSSSKEIQELDIEMKANTTYTFFSSILIDETLTLQNHIIYTDANALSEHKPAFFMGEQLLLGKALIIGKNGLEESDVTIPQDTLEEIINYDIPEFYKNSLKLLAKSDINLYRNFTVLQGNEKLALNTEWVLYTFNIADERTKEYFLNELQKTLQANESVEAYIQKMATLAIKSTKQA